MKSERRLLINELRALKKRGVYDGPITTENSGDSASTEVTSPQPPIAAKVASSSTAPSKQPSTDENVLVNF